MHTCGSGFRLRRTALNKSIFASWKYWKRMHLDIRPWLDISSLSELLQTFLEMSRPCDPRGNKSVGAHERKLIHFAYPHSSSRRCLLGIMQNLKRTQRINWCVFVHSPEALLKPSRSARSTVHLLLDLLLVSNARLCAHPLTLSLVQLSPRSLFRF